MPTREDTENWDRLHFKHGKITADHWPSLTPGTHSSGRDRKNDGQGLRGYWRRGKKFVLQILITVWPCFVLIRTSCSWRYICARVKEKAGQQGMCLFEKYVTYICDYIWASACPKLRYINFCVCHLNRLKQIEPPHNKISKSHHQCPPPLPSPPPPFTPSNVLSVHKHKLNLLLMIALLTRWGSIHSHRPTTTTGQISWREGRKNT